MDIIPLDRCWSTFLGELAYVAACGTPQLAHLGSRQEGQFLYEYDPAHNLHRWIPLHSRAMPKMLTLEALCWAFVKFFHRKAIDAKLYSTRQGDIGPRGQYNTRARTLENSATLITLIGDLSACRDDSGVLKALLKLSICVL